MMFDLKLRLLLLSHIGVLRQRELVPHLAKDRVVCLIKNLHDKALSKDLRLLRRRDL